MTAYHIVGTFINCEARASRSLKQLGFEVYQPLTATPRHANRSVTYLPRALFPSVLFVRDDGCGISVIMTAPGVSYVEMTGSWPLRLDASWVEHLKARESHGLVVLDSADRTSVSALVSFKPSWLTPLLKPMRAAARTFLLRALVAREPQTLAGAA